ncbi:hypothetical protein Tco_0663419 [Tanacetum coccineum]
MAVNEDSWFEAMQDKIHEFDRLKVQELVPRPDYDYKFLKSRGNLINQAKYALETLKKYRMDLSDPVDTPMVDQLKLDEDLIGIPIQSKPNSKRKDTLTAIKRVFQLRIMRDVQDSKFGLRQFKTYDGESLKAQELCEKVHQEGNNHVGAIMGYEDYMIGDSVVSRAYYVEGLGHNLFFVGQFCDSDLEVTFRKHSCFVRNMDGVDLLKGWRSTNLYTISVDEMLRSSQICLLSKASKNKSWLWMKSMTPESLKCLQEGERFEFLLPRLGMKSMTPESLKCLQEGDDE